MLRSLYSGISGLQANQTMLDVAGNNIANVNTVGFKSSAVQFESTLSQLVSGATAPNGGVGGTNPAQVGLGVKVAGISVNFTQGSAESTGVGTNLMLNGDGFFVVSNGGQQQYTRAGDFSFNGNGQLVAADGSSVQGWMANGAGQVNTGGQLTNLTLPLNTAVGAAATSQASFTGNLPSDATAGTLVTRDIPVYNTSGVQSTLTLNFTSNGTGGWAVADSAGNSLGTLQFTNGALASGGPTLTDTVGGNTVSLDVSQLTGYAGLSTMAVANQNGHAAGTLTSYSIGNDGTITGVYSNGVTQAIGQIAIANFTNPEGLQANGGNNYTTSANSGTMTVGTAGSAGFGSLSSGYLEASNVDLSQEFTNLIVAQRGFQASARVITTSDDVLQELVNLKQS